MKIIIVLAAIISLVVCQQQYRLCLSTLESQIHCDNLNRGNEVVCIKAKDSTECSLKLQKGEADFTVLSPEQSLLASRFISDQTSVIAEVRAKVQERYQHNFQMVVVVRRGHTGGLLGLRNKKYCHPGFTGHTLWTLRTLKEFEAVLFRDQLRQSCNNKENISYVERELRTINDFFGDSCRRGPWTDDSILNENLERQYPKLTALCTNEHTSLNSLTCMNVNNADVAYTTLSEAMKITNKDEFRLLCKNDTLVPINASTAGDCSWRNQPWSLIVSRRNIADEVRRNLKSWINPEFHAVLEGATPFSDGPSSRGRQQWQDTLATVLLRDTNQYRLNVLFDAPLLNQFLKRNQQDQDSILESECPMRWCTVSEQEQNKCQWLARASLIAGVEPQTRCVAGKHIYDCLKKIHENQADIIAIDSDYGYLARRVGIHNLLYSENSALDISSIVAVIREESKIQTFKDLKNKRACFPEFIGLAWVSFIDAAHKHKVMKDSCEFGKTVSEFFDGVCAPGAKDGLHYRKDNELYDKLCSVCPDNCESDTSNRYFNHTGALSCLADNKADVAFVKWQAIEDVPNLSNYRILCNDDRVISVDEYRSNGATCSLSDTVDSEVIARYNDTRKVDYKHGLFHMDTLFGTSVSVEKTFRMFKEFNGEKNLLFKENVLGLDDGQSPNRYVQNYVKLFESVDICTAGSSIVNVSTITLFITSLLVMLITRHM